MKNFKRNCGLGLSINHCYRLSDTLPMSIIPNNLVGTLRDYCRSTNLGTLSELNYSSPSRDSGKKFYRPEAIIYTIIWAR
jgi:hypothetical protein